MRKFSALLFALPCVLFADSTEAALEEDAMDEAAIEKLFIGMEKDIAMLDEMSDEEAQKLFEDSGMITMSEEAAIEGTLK